MLALVRSFAHRVLDHSKTPIVEMRWLPAVDYEQKTWEDTKVEEARAGRSSPLSEHQRSDACVGELCCCYSQQLALRDSPRPEGKGSLLRQMAVSGGQQTLFLPCVRIRLRIQETRLRSMQSRLTRRNLKGLQRTVLMSSDSV